MLVSTIAGASHHPNHLQASDQHHSRCPRHHRSNECQLVRQRRNSMLLTQDGDAARGSCARLKSVWRDTLVLTSWCLAIVLLLTVPLSQAYPSGAPEQACKDLKPGHGVEPQTGASPFELTQDKLQVGAGDQIKVTLSSPSGTNFKGLIVQARNEAGELKGKFLPGTGLKTLDSCSAVTHSDKEAKKTATLVWQAPDDLKSKEAFVFKATVVKKFDEIYTDVKSSLRSS